jgi:hypothetical protein
MKMQYTVVTRDGEIKKVLIGDVNIEGIYKAVISKEVNDCDKLELHIACPEGLKFIEELKKIVKS